MRLARELIVGTAGLLAIAGCSEPTSGPTRSSSKSSAKSNATSADETSVQTATREAIVGGPCEGCELIFEGMPTELDATSRIAPKNAAGAPLEIHGVVTDAEGKVAVGVVVYAYQTNSGGLYPNRSRENFHGSFRGWARTDRDGRFSFRTVRPGSYPQANPPPQHVHMHILEPGRCTYYIESIEFTDDPLLGSGRNASPRAGAGVVVPHEDDGRWRVRRDIVLGLNIPGYRQC